MIFVLEVPLTMVIIGSCNSLAPQKRSILQWMETAPCHELTTNYCQLVVAINVLQWRHNERDGVSNHQPHDCLLNGLFRRRSKKTSKLRVTGLCAGNSPVTGEFPAQRANNAENISIWWCHHGWNDQASAQLHPVFITPFDILNVTRHRYIQSKIDISICSGSG